MSEIVKDISKTEYKIERLGSVKVNALIGGRDVITGGKFVPNLNLSYEMQSEGIYKQEHYFVNINKKDATITTEKETLENGEISLPHVDGKHIFRTLDGDIEWDIEFDSRPSVNHWDWELTHSPGISFHYQDTLENDYINYAHKEFDSLEEFLSMGSRPDNVVGSYVIMIDKKNNIKDANGVFKAKYATGKIGHIFTPYFIDAKGDRGKGVLYIYGDLLRISCDPAWLDKAIYPVILDPNFGNDVCGGTPFSLAGIRRAVQGTSAGAGTGDSCSVCMDGWGSGEAVQMCLYADGGSSPIFKITDGECAEKTTGSADGVFTEFPFNSPPTILAATDYFPVAWGDGDVKNTRYDSVSVIRIFDPQVYSQNNWPASFSCTYGSSTFNYSTFCTYTESDGGGGAIPLLVGGGMGQTLGSNCNLMTE
jgi:hypothetical protein